MDESTYQNDRVVSWRFREHCLCALDAIQYCVGCNVNLGKEFEDDLVMC